MRKGASDINSEPIPANIYLPSRRLEDAFKICLEDVFKHMFSVTTFCLPRRLEVVLQSLEDVLKTSLEDILKTSWRQAKCLLGISVYNKSKRVSNKSVFHKSRSDESKANLNSINYRTQ